MSSSSLCDVDHDDDDAVSRCTFIQTLKHIKKERKGQTHWYKVLFLFSAQEMFQTSIKNDSKTTAMITDLLNKSAISSVYRSSALSDWLPCGSWATTSPTTGLPYWVKIMSWTSCCWCYILTVMLCLVVHDDLDWELHIWLFRITFSHHAKSWVIKLK